MITQSQFPFEGIKGADNKAFKIIGISLITVGVITGVYLIAKAIKQSNEAKVVETPIKENA